MATGVDPHRLLPDHLRAGDRRRLPRRLERDARAAHAADVASPTRSPAIILVGAMLAAGPDECSTGAAGSASLAVALASVNVFGGFLVTQRMLEMFKKKEPKAPAPRQALTATGENAMSANQVALWYLVASVCFILALKGLSHPSTARRGNVFGIDRHGDRRRRHAGARLFEHEERRDDPRGHRRRRRRSARSSPGACR